MKKTLKNKTKSTIIIQARTGSSRLPKKVLSKIQSKPMIWHVINRVKKVKNVEQIILATSTNVSDKPLVKIAEQENILAFTGNPTDVLDRYYQASLKFNANPIIRITGDCPLIDPKLISKMLDFFQHHKFDFLSNNLNPTYPDGLDASIFSFNALEQAWKKANLQSEREHVVPYITKHKNIFKIFSYENSKNLSNYRWTVDEKNDLTFVRKIYHLMKPKNIFYTNDVLKIIRQNPALLTINSSITRDEGYAKSLKNDQKFNL
ncbi:MAG: cytidylyltransferase domain-containing protein [Candidatus Nitrosopumilus sp. bin_32a]